MAVNFSTGKAEAERVVAEIVAGGGRAVATRADVAKEEEIVQMFEIAERELGPIHGLVNNAGVTGGFARVEAVTAAALEKVFAVNVAGTILCAREAVRRMSTRRGGTGGAIVNVSSRAAHTGSAGEWVHYAASKGAVDSFTIGLAREVATEGIRVNAVAPGLVDTGRGEWRTGPGTAVDGDNPDGKSRDAARNRGGCVVALSPEASYTTGAILEVGGGR